MNQAPASSTLRFIAGCACAIAFLAFTLHAYLWAPRLTYGFAMYYTYARLALGGESLDRAYDEVYFQERLQEFGFELRDEPNNAPTASLAMMPLAWLPPVAARIAWSSISLAAFAWAIVLLFRLSGIPPWGTGGLWLLTVVCIWKPAYDTVAFGQIYFLLLLLFALSMMGLIRRKPLPTAIPLAMAILVKGYGALPAFLLATRRLWKEVALVAAVAGVVVLASLPVLGAGSWSVFLSKILPSMGLLPPHAHVAYQTVNGFIRHLFTYDPVWSPHPAAVIPPVAVAVLSYGINAAVIVLVIIRSRLDNPRETFLSFATVLAAGVVTAPLAEEYHYVLFLPLVFALSSEFAASPGVWKKSGSLVAAAAVLLLAAPLKYKALQLAAFPAVLLAYPKLYAGLALLACAWVVLGEKKAAGGLREQGAPDEAG